MFAAGLHRPDERDLARLRQGHRLLGELLPLTSRSALSHTHLIGITSGTDAWEGKASSSQFTMVGIVFLNRKLLQNPWWVAEHLFHEALHQKLYDFRHAHSMLVRDLDDSPHAPTEVRRVVSLWNVPGLNGSNRWNAHRTMAAFHVYVHLALLCSLAEQHAPRLRDVYGPLDAPSPMTPSRKAFEQQRHHIADTLLRLAPNGYSLDSLCRAPGPSADEMVRVMVETSSRELAAASPVLTTGAGSRAVNSGSV